MYENVFLPVQALDRPIPKPGGLCAVKFFRWEDVQTWPTIDPQIGICKTAIEMKPDTYIYLCDAIEKGKSFNEKMKIDPRGSFMDMTIDAVLPEGSVSNILSLQTMKNSQWGLLLNDKMGYTRLIGDKDSGADLLFEYDSGDTDSSRKMPVKWQWKNETPAPFYIADAFDIIIGGVPVTAGCLRLIMRFVVGRPDAFANPPIMNDGDTVLTRPAFLNKNLLVLADGIALPVDDGTGAIDWTGSIKRHIEKAYDVDTINFIGGVVDNETIEIYAWT